MMTPLAAVADAASASRLLLHPLRVRILAGAREPTSSTELGRRLGEARQKVNYHVHELARSGFLEAAGDVARRNLVERLWVATARTYVLLPEVLGPLAADRESVGDAASAARLLGLTAMMQSELAHAWRESSAAGVRMPTLSMDAEVRLEDEEQRAAFAQALRSAVSDVIARFAGDAGGSGRRYRLMAGVYPMPESAIG